MFNFTLVRKRASFGTAGILFGINHSGAAPVTIPESIIFEELNLKPTIRASKIEDVFKCPVSGILTGALHDQFTQKV
ncbi:MAG: hypothetical protein HOE30_05550 [Deltaproteobacteria bacterium]|nr:hypothetical protein [Deltaproteobacteria bacterium]